MPKYIIEGNINFYDELFKSLDDDTDNENDDLLCKITGLPFDDKHVKLECGHKFNYDSLYKEIYNQKYLFKTYDIYSLTRKDAIKFRSSGLDYFIKCPYCRNIQFTILPYYEELGLEKKYGINSLDTALREPITLNNSSGGPLFGSDEYTFTTYNVLFKKGTCCLDDSCKTLLMGKYVSTIPNTELSYCKYHYKQGLKSQLLSEKNKLLEEKNKERALKGLAPLKRLVKKKNINENIVHTPLQVGEYIPEEQIGCKAILKTGVNKGKLCGCKKLDTSGFCKRHSISVKDNSVKSIN